jgi:hypothetical protein
VIIWFNFRYLEFINQRLLQKVFVLKLRKKKKLSKKSIKVYLKNKENKYKNILH